MRYKIVVDSCCELPEEYRNDPRFERVPLAIEVGAWQTMDDENFDQKEFLLRVAETDACPKSACPSPDRYCRAYETEAEDVFVVTLSSHLSGSYNSALLGKNIYEEEHGRKNIYICDLNPPAGERHSMLSRPWSSRRPDCPLRRPSGSWSVSGRKCAHGLCSIPWSICGKTDGYPTGRPLSRQP